MASVKVLIIEDEELIAEDMANKLTKFGYEITDYVETCADALESIKRTPPDVIFLDIIIAGEYDGIDTALKIKAIEDFPIIFLSNISDSNTLQRALATNPANYLKKPFTPDQLHISVQTALFNHAEKRRVGINDAFIENPEALVRKDKLFLKDANDTYRKYDISNILFIEADRAYCHIYMADGTKLTQSVNMGAMSVKINHPNLIRVHRSHIVNIDNVDAVKGNVLILGKHEVIVSETFKEEVFKHLPPLL